MLFSKNIFITEFLNNSFVNRWIATFNMNCIKILKYKYLVRLKTNKVVACYSPVQKQCLYCF